MQFSVLIVPFIGALVSATSIIPGQGAVYSVALCNSEVCAQHPLNDGSCNDLASTDHWFDNDLDSINIVALTPEQGTKVDCTFYDTPMCGEGKTLEFQSPGGNVEELGEGWSKIVSSYFCK